MRNVFSIAAFCVVTLAFTGSAAEETQLKPQAYETRQASPSSSLRSSSFHSAPSQTLRSKQAEKQIGRWWQFFRSRKPDPAAAPFSGAAPAASVPLRQDQQISAATLKAAPPSVTEKKPYETGVSKTVKPYTPDNRPRPKNPLLRPRQNIKEPQ